MIRGYAVVFDTWTDIGSEAWGFRERVVPEAVERTLREAKINVRSLFNHKDDYILGTTKAKTLRVGSDDKGVWYEIDMPNTSYANDLIESIRRGDIYGSSFAFRTLKESWRFVDKGRDERTLLDIDIYDVSPVTNPAYEDTSVAVRSYSQHVRDNSLSKARLRLAESGVC